MVAETVEKLAGCLVASWVVGTVASKAVTSVVSTVASWVVWWVDQ